MDRIKIVDSLRGLEIGHRIIAPPQQYYSILTTKDRLQKAGLGLWEVARMAEQVRITRKNLPLSDFQLETIETLVKSQAEESLPGTEEIKIQDSVEGMEIDCIVTLDWTIKKHTYLDMPADYDTKLNDWDTVGTVDVYDQEYNTTITHQKI